MQTGAKTLTPRSSTPVKSEEKPAEVEPHEPKRHIENTTKGMRATFFCKAVTFSRDAYIFSRDAYIFSRDAYIFSRAAATFFSKAYFLFA